MAKIIVFGVLFVLTVFVNNSVQQKQNLNIQGLSYSNTEFDTYNPVIRATTTTTVAPETTTKKGFFSGLAFWKKDKNKEAEEASSTVSSSTVKVTTPSSVTTPKQVPVSSTTTQKSVQTSSTVQTPNVVVSTPPTVQVPTPTTQRSVPAQSTPFTQKVVVQTPSSTTTQRPSSTTTKKAPVAIFDDFPPLPTKKTPTGQPGQTGPTTPQNPWTATQPSGKPGGVQFIPNAGTTTQRSASPSSPSDTSSTNLATDAELLTLSESLFNKDINNAFKFVTVNYQGRTHGSSTTDEASQAFLAIDDRLYTIPTVSKMKLLYNNYEQDTGINEYVSPLEKKEEDEFVEELLQTPVMKHLMTFLQQKGIVTIDSKTHKDLLKTLWFNMYSRGQGKIGSSGFEHVFMSEIRNGSVMGLHNYIYFSEEEKEGDADYKGYSKKIDLGNKGQIAKIRFTLNSLNKPVNTMFIGTSPELELALYTACFVLRADGSCPLAYGGNRFSIVTHTFRYRGKNCIGSAYPDI